MSEKLKKILKITVIVFLVLTALFFWAEKGYNFVAKFLADDNCPIENDIATINIRGDIVSYFLKSTGSSGTEADATSADNVLSCIKTITDDGMVKGVVFQIDSRGGSPEASEEMANAIKGLKIPTVAVIRGAGDSAAYLIASATNRIFASEWSEVGSIGITMSYLDNSQKNTTDGLTFNQLSAGQFKDSGSPDKPLTEKEKALFMRDTNIMYEGFIQKVADNRHLDVSKVRELADGSTMLGLQAKESGLIDEIGDINSAKAWLENK